MEKAERVRTISSILIITSSRVERSIYDAAESKIEEYVKNTYFLYDAAQHWPPRGSRIEFQILV